LGVPIHSPSPVVAHLGTLKDKFARMCAAVVALANTQSAHALMRSCLGPAKVQYALRTLPIRHTAAFAADVTATQRATCNAVVGTPTSDEAWVHTTLPLSEGGCGVASAADVAAVARLQFLAWAKPPDGVRHLGRPPGAGKDVVKVIFARCTASLLLGARPAAVGALRKGLGVQLGRSVARQLAAVMMVSTETPAW